MEWNLSFNRCSVGPRDGLTLPRGISESSNGTKKATLLRLHASNRRKVTLLTFREELFGDLVPFEDSEIPRGRDQIISSLIFSSLRSIGLPDR